jgi:hypothetical protein
MTECTRIRPCYQYDDCNFCRTSQAISADKPDNKANIKCTEEDWLIKIADVPINSVGYVLCSRLTKESAQAAADAQYGKGAFTIKMHGTHMYAWRRHPKSEYAKARYKPVTVR